MVRDRDAIDEEAGDDAIRAEVSGGLTGSAILTLAVLHGRLDAAGAWAAAHVDEDYEIELWGEDAEATARREARWREMQAAALVVAARD